MLLKLRAPKQRNKTVKFAVSKGTQKALSTPLVSASLCVYVCFVALSYCLLSHQLHDLIENGTFCSQGTVTYSRLVTQQETELLLLQAKEQLSNSQGRDQLSSCAKSPLSEIRGYGGGGDTSQECVSSWDKLVDNRGGGNVQRKQLGNSGSALQSNFSKQVVKKGEHRPSKLGTHKRGQKHSLVIKKENAECKVVEKQNK